MVYWAKSKAIVHKGETNMKARFFLDKLLLNLVVAALLLVLPFIVGHYFGNAWMRTTNFALLYVLLAIGLNMVVGFAGLLDLGFIAFYAVGAYTYALLNSPQFGLSVPFYISIPIGAVLAGICGILLGTPVLRLRGDYLAIVTLGFGEIIRIILNNLNGLTNGSQGIMRIEAIKFGSFALDKKHTILGITFQSTYLYYYLLLAMVLLFVVFATRLQYSRIGRAWVAMREDDVAAAAMGINLKNMKLLAFSLGALSGGVAGGFFSAMIGYVSPESFVLNESIIILTMVVLGGMGNIKGVILGAIILTFVPELLRTWVEDVQKSLFNTILLPKENARMLLFGMAMVLMMILRPQGILPSKRRATELSGRLKPTQGEQV